VMRQGASSAIFSDKKAPMLRTPRLPRLRVT